MRVAEEFALTTDLLMTADPHHEYLVRRFEDWDVVNEMALDFEDGVVREALIVSPSYVDDQGRMVYVRDGGLVAHAQMQGAFGTGGTSVRLTFSGVRSAIFDAELEVTPARARAAESGAWEVELLSLRVVASECEVLVVGRCGLGTGPFLPHGKRCNEDI